MKKIMSIIILSLFITGFISPVFAINVGTYKTETEYGLLDGFKFNWKRKEGQKFIEPREQSSRKDMEKEYKDYQETEYERTKYMYDGIAII